MGYQVNGSAMSAPFFVPASIVDKHLKLATESQIKVLLFSLKNISSGIEPDVIADFLKLPLDEVNDALEFWVQAKVLVNDSKQEPAVSKKDESDKSVIKPVTVKPTREEISSIALTDNKLSFLLGEAEMKLGRAMRSNEIQNLAWLYLDHSMDVSLILMLVEYAVTENKATVSFIEKVALSWLDAGVTTLAQAEEQIELRSRKKTAWGMVESAFGLDHRLPSDKELEFAGKWIIEWHFSREMLKEAYNRCVDTKAKLDMRYINGILERWFKEGIKNPSDIEKQTKSKQDSMATYDKNLVNRLLNNDD